MTVEQSLLPQSYNKNQPERPVRIEPNVLEQIKEVTGIEDVKVISQAISACCTEQGKYDLSEVVSLLVSEVATIKPTQQKPEPVEKPEKDTEQTTTKIITQPTDATDVPVNTRKSKSDSALVDLTNDEDQLQKAIAASLQDNQGILGGQISREEQDISRILEASLAESKAGTKRKRGDIWFVDPLNPYERRRKEAWPVGLKNVGNTCWFSAVIQSLFHLPIFRHLVLNFVSPAETPQGTLQEKRNLRFMHELRRLFALMIGSQRKYVDPSKAVDILKEAFTSPSGTSDSQQDVSEFQHKLLEWLEEAFTCHDSRPTSPTQGTSSEESLSSAKNPMIDLFYGQVTTDGFHEGKAFCRQETFGQFPLQVNGFHDIHESLENATAQGEIETVTGESSSKSGQEQWFTRLPPFLTFELSRFQFNQTLGRPEKIHNKLKFPMTIYMDRYMECNKSVTRQRREKVKSLREELQHLHSRLDRFTNYGSGPKRFPLQDVLQYALEFAQTNPDVACSSPAGPAAPPVCDVVQDVEMESPRSLNNSSNLETPSPSLVKSSSLPDVAMASPHGKLSSPAKRLLVVPKPAPREVSSTELGVLQSCLTRWRTEVESDVKELQDGISRLDEEVGNMYSDDMMKKFPYRLHAVLVHEGQAASGHYWAYVYDHANGRWLKFNDITVTEASWEELEKEGIGGYHNASAYCLMYVDTSREDLIQDSSSLVDKETGQISNSTQTDVVKKLAQDLQDYISEDNTKFCQEMEDWDRKQQQAAAATVTTAPAAATVTTAPGAGGDSEVTIVGEKKPLSPTVSSSVQNSQSYQHALLALRSTVDTLEAVLGAMTKEQWEQKRPEGHVLQVANFEINKAEKLSQKLPEMLPKKDSRLSHMLVYCIACKAPTHSVIHRVVMEQIAFTRIGDTDAKFKAIKGAAERKLSEMISDASEQMKSEYKKWHENFSNFRRVIMCVVLGIEAFHKERYQESLPYLHYAYLTNRSLIADGNRMKGFDNKLMAYYQRQCLLHLNDMALQQFEADEDISGVSIIMNNLVLPCLPSLFHTSYQDDTLAAEELREKWCNILAQEVSGDKLEKLQDVMSKLFDPPSETRTSVKFPQLNYIKDSSEFLERYAKVMDLAEKNSYLEMAEKSK
ncbi:ubiquitin carboxyl-terminal hydrolase 25-like isoform X2 [Lingula anatina]|uniref:Ubiquitin carboxyl-terminal hydrolase 25-like isoform X2 n=1 Tax=Lingula anatina TaxID=7574 RepID=A0A1S3KHR7_LINAN|nr:ubiquitin carboxyl-terminal hydrolase 25-like isoform X2 [Lingula anatina]|eukprot:XP_013422019.1 ubiquitin carboxyl-terminal hydrolase 25-like isoform X2 [Lingula anatina]